MADYSEYCLSADRSEVLQQALNSHGRTEKELEEHIRILKKWLRTQPHLPETPSDNHLMNVLLMNNFSIENCKQRLDMYYTIRNSFPEIYGSLNSKNMMRLADSLYSFPLPKRTPEGDRITIFKPMVMSVEDFDVNKLLALCFNTLDVRLGEDTFTAEIIITDLQAIKLSFLTRITPVHLKNAVLIIEKVYSNSFKQVHLVNCAPFINNTIRLLKSMMKPKLAARMFSYEDSSILKEIFPPEILPKDFGGQELSLYELNESWKKKLALYADRFDSLAEMKTNENLRPTQLVNDGVLGFHGNFRKLEMD